MARPYKKLDDKELQDKLEAAMIAERREARVRRIRDEIKRSKESKNVMLKASKKRPD